MEQLVKKVHYEIPMHHGGLQWRYREEGDPFSSRQPLIDQNTYMRTQLFKTRMMHLERELTNEKMKIEKIKRSLWDYFKKIINPYEYVHLNKPYIQTSMKPVESFHPNVVGIADYEPISRAYYKLWEILHDFPILDTDRPIRYAAIAEGPGGFIEAFFHYRRRYNGESIEEILNKENPSSSIRCVDKVTAITLCDTKKPQIPGWKKSSEFLEMYRDHIEISYGADGTGNLYLLENIHNFCELFTDKADFITADGGFDFSDDYTHQEQTLYQLLLAEIIIGLRILRRGGCMIIKVFDFMTDESVELLYMLSSLFRRTYITKPFTSRVMNSEKYIVATGFMVCEETQLNKVLDDNYISQYLEAKRVDIIHHLEIHFVNKDKMMSTTLLEPYAIPSGFIETMERCNIGYGMRQLTYLTKTFQLVEEDISSHTINELKKDQCTYAVSWCKKYKFPIHFKSKLFKEIDTYHYIPIF